MEIGKLNELLVVIEYVTSNRWQMVRDIVTQLNLGVCHASVIQKQYSNTHKANHPEDYPLDLNKIETWQTYEQCIDLKFYASEDYGLLCNAIIYDGTSLNGKKISERFRATINLNKEFLSYIEPLILHKFNRFAEEAYETHLQAQKINWMNEFKDHYLK